MFKFSCFFLVVIVATFAKEIEYPKGLEGVNIDDVIKNRRLLIGYIKCCLGEGNCTPEGNKLKAILPDAIENQCSKCTEEQKEAAEKVCYHIIDNLDEWWNKLERKFDPEGNYKKRYCAKLEELGKDTRNKCT